MTLTRMMFAPLALLGFVAIGGLPSQAAAQADGCPWCTTPTTCSLVEESTNLNSCTVSQGQGCVPQYGECEFNPSEEEEQQQLLALGLNPDRTLSVDVLTGPVKLTEVSPGRFAGWSCQGALRYLVEVDGVNSVKWLRTDEYQAYYSIAAIAGRAEPLH